MKMQMLKEYKTFSKETGEIKVDCQLCVDHGEYLINTNNTLTRIGSKDEICEYYEKLLEMDKYIASTVPSYEVYVVLE